MSRCVEAAAERVGQQLLGQRARRTARARCSSAWRSADDAVDLACRRPAAPEASIGCRASAVACAPRADRVEVLEREARADPSRVWQVAQAGLRAVLLHPLAHRARLVAASLLPRAAARSAGGGGGGVPRRFSRTHLPRSTGEVRSACDVTVRMLPLPSRPRRASSVQRDAAEVAAVDVGDAVVPRQPLVDERVVGGQQVEDAAVLAHDAVEEQLGLALRTPGAGCRRSRGTRASSGCLLRRLRRCSHWPAKLSTSACAFGSASMRRTCCSSTAGFCSLPCAASAEQLVVGNAAPEEERQPRRQLEIAEAIGGARRHAGRVALDAEQELRAGEDAAQRQLDAARRTCPPPCGRARRTRAARCRSASRDGAAVGAARERRQDLPRARRFVGRGRRPAR